MTTGYYRSKHIQLLKIAMLVSLSESTNLTIHIRHLEAGLAILGIFERNLARVFMGIGRNELNAVAAKMLNTIESAPIIQITNNGAVTETPGLLEKRLFAAHFADGTQPELIQSINHLIAAGKAVRHSVIIGQTSTTYICKA